MDKGRHEKEDRMKAYTQTSGSGGSEQSCYLLGGEVFWGMGEGEVDSVILSC